MVRIVSFFLSYHIAFHQGIVDIVAFAYHINFLKSTSELCFE